MVYTFISNYHKIYTITIYTDNYNVYFNELYGFPCEVILVVYGTCEIIHFVCIIICIVFSCVLHRSNREQKNIGNIFVTPIALYQILDIYVVWMYITQE